MNGRQTDRASHAPDPHVLYRRLDSWLSGDPADGSVLLVNGGIAVVPISDPGSQRDDGVPDSTLYRFPRLSELDREAIESAVAATDRGLPPLHQIAVAAGEPVYALSARGLGDPPALLGAAGSEVAEAIGYRELYGVIGDDELALVGRAMQVVDWDETTGYCPRYAAVTEPSESECVKRCPECNLTQYPRLAPAMIVGVVRDGRLLLGQSPRFRGRFHSILAGFLEPGESAEECVRREVFEEVGISVRDIRYFGSQAWPFPHSLMLGFTAEYDSGELDPDPAEILHADWYAPDELPNVPGEVSISGRIINWFRRTYG